MIITLDSNKRIEYYLSHFIEELEICKYIINLKNDMEEKDIFEYHHERWENISGKYFKSFDYNQSREIIYYSYVIDSNRFIAKKDKCLDYYLETGISFQVRDLLLDIITKPSLDMFFPNLGDKSKNNVDRKSILSKDIKEWRKEDDEIYSKLAQKIMDKLNN